jgi:hypothetical protein
LSTRNYLRGTWGILSVEVEIVDNDKVVFHGLAKEVDV